MQPKCSFRKQPPPHSNYCKPNRIRRNKSEMEELAPYDAAPVFDRYPHGNQPYL